MKQFEYGPIGMISPVYILPPENGIHGTHGVCNEHGVNQMDDDISKTFESSLDRTSDLNKFRSAVMDAIKIPNMFPDSRRHSSENSGNEGDEAILSDEYSKVKAIVEKYWPDETTEHKVEYYNALKTCINSSEIFLQHCKTNDIQVRVVEFKSSRLIKFVDGFIYISQLGDFFDEMKEMYRQATYVKFIGSLVNVRNTSNDNGKYIDVICARRTSDFDVSNADMYDVNGLVTSISNRDKYTKFIPPTRAEYSTKSLTEIISNFTIRDDWNTVKDEVYDLISQMTNGDITSKMIKNSGNTLRCIDMAGPLGYDDILTYGAFKDRCAVIGNRSKKQPGRTAIVHDTYLAITRVGEEVPCTITVYGVLLLDKSLNNNIDVKLDDERKYTILPLICDDVYNVIEGYLNRENNSQNITQKVKEMKIDYLLGKHDIIVLKNGEYVRPYKEGDKLMEGESVIKSKYKFF